MVALRLDLVAKREYGSGVTGEDAEVRVGVPRDQRAVANGAEQRPEVEPVADSVPGEQVVDVADQLEEVPGAAVGPDVCLAPVPEAAVRGRPGARPPLERDSRHQRTTVKLRRRTRSMISVLEMPFA